MTDKQTNSVIESQLRALAEIGCRQIQQHDDKVIVDDQRRIRPLVDSLIRNGYERLSDVRVSVRLEELISSVCLDRDTANSRRAEVSAYTAGVQEMFQALSLGKAHSPPDDDETSDSGSR